MVSIKNSQAEKKVHWDIFQSGVSKRRFKRRTNATMSGSGGDTHGTPFVGEGETNHYSYSTVLIRHLPENDHSPICMTQALIRIQLMVDNK